MEKTGLISMNFVVCVDGDGVSDQTRREKHSFMILLDWLSRECFFYKRKSPNVIKHQLLCSFSFTKATKKKSDFYQSELKCCQNFRGHLVVFWRDFLFCSYFPLRPARQTCAANKSRAGRWTPKKPSLMGAVKWRDNPWKKTGTRTTVGGQDPSGKTNTWIRFCLQPEWLDVY